MREAKNMQVVTDGDGSRASISDAKRTKLAEKVKQFLHNNPGARIMIFAPWCPHCHTQMPLFVNAAIKDKAHKFLIVNHEALPPSMFGEGKDSIYPLQYFPTFCTVMHGGKLAEVRLEDIASTPSSPPPSQAAAASGGQQEETESSMLNRLFS